ncbi:HAD superfamily hydrolase (TIGR01450 family) [Antricoccus suffuscus]|uniref:HAD superfamily hydrolase (TIGR01450 family) n=1 Tax=Antricoccus suffuscus TaxID=1629062 RepID=A0A2T0ZX64_9ACTN|nr:HAD-IIA family hydrolase [Antricoccus suffuscus]PRZ40949.1 HAD superfamily hydrolase (TIGR01450 family) [Antricoccus suffuscus]
MDADENALARQYDVALFDLDGVIYSGDEPVGHAAASLEAALEAGMRAAYVTNNASRTPAEVVEKLAAVGVQAKAEEIITSAQVAAEILRDRLEPGALVLIVGDRGLRDAVAAVGLRITDKAADKPAAVVQGFSRKIGWAQLSEATVAARAGALWIATNLDSTIPSARGILPGNGAMIDVVATALGRRPDAVAGKPDRTMQTASVKRTQAHRPLVIGDRLDTDIEGANRSDCDSLLVMTGVTTPAGLLEATEELRPTYIGADLRDLLKPGRGVPRSNADGWTIGCWQASSDGQIRQTAAKSGDQDPLDYLRIACAISWSGGQPQPADDAASAESRSLSLN